MTVISFKPFLHFSHPYRAMVVEPAASSPVDNRISQEANDDVPTSHQSNDQTLNNAVSSSSDPKGTITNAAPAEPQVPMDLPISNPVQSQPDTAAIVQNDCKSPLSSISVNSSLVSSVISSQDSTSLNIPLSNSNPNSHADNSPSPSSVSPSLTSTDLPSSEKCGMSNTALHANPGQCIPTMGCNAADPNNLSPVENSSNHTMVNDVGNTDIGINIKADLKMELSEEVPSPTTPTTSPVDGDSSPEAAVTISPVAVQEESNNVHSDLVNNDANLSPEGDTADKLR